MIYSSGYRDVAFVAYRYEKDRLFISKLYVVAGLRGIGISTRIVENLKELCIDRGFNKMYLTVNRDNQDAVRAYKCMGFVIKKETDTPIGEGYEMNDYLMELTF